MASDSRFGPEPQHELDRLHAQFPLKQPLRLEWRDLPVTAGRADLLRGVLVLSRIVLTTEDAWRTTLRHEYAHFLVAERFGRRVKPHGAEWRAMMALLGEVPKVTHNYPVQRSRRARRIVLRCARCGTEFRRTRIANPNGVYRHTRCGGAVTVERIEPR